MTVRARDTDTGRMPPASADSATPPSPDTRCPCLSGETFGACCARFLTGAADAPTAEQLMRSRFSAFAIGDAPYLLATWHPTTRPAELDLDASLRWYRLDIHRRVRGGPLDRDGVVEFTAYYRHDGERGQLHEVSRFVRDGGRWRYLAAS
ncbi:MAG: zinc-binding protein [Agromyces sp.]|nr:zinc-binding protein [Agromyces sp.]